ncbi:MAG TPA: aldo/keto reductase [Rhizobiaceae bacterium]|nr:aldo/keto reductase [Rhizobiaceae bacterium]
MEFRTLGKTGLRCSVLGLGTARLTSLATKLSRRDALKLIDLAAAQGINLIDTADIYGQGESEEVVGQALRGRRDDFVIATKVGYSFSGSGRLLAMAKPILKPMLRPLKAARSIVSNARSNAQAANILRQDFSPNRLAAAVDASLRRLRTGYVDILYLHDVPADAAGSPEVIEALKALCRSGKVRYVGLSSGEEDVLGLAAGQSFFAAVQMPLDPSSLASRTAVLRKLADAGIGVVANRTFESGAEPGRQDSRQAALALAARQPGICSVLTGTTSADHLRENVAGTLAALQAEPSGPRP